MKNDYRILPYPQNFYSIVFERHTESYMLPSDINETLDVVLGSMKPHETKTIMMYLKDRASFGMIGDHFGVSRQRASQIFERAIYKIKHSSLIYILFNGISLYNAQQGLFGPPVPSHIFSIHSPISSLGFFSDDLCASLCSAGIKNVFDILFVSESKLISDFKLSPDSLEKLKSILIEHGYGPEYKPNLDERGLCAINEFKQQGIEILSLKIRAWNSLKRGRINTIEDLMNLSRDELARFNGIGVNSIAHISEALSKYGLSLRGDHSTTNHTLFVSHYELYKPQKIISSSKIEDLLDYGLSRRAFNALKRGKICTVGDLLNMTERSLTNLPNIGAGSLTCIKTILEQLDLQLAPI